MDFKLEILKNYFLEFFFYICFVGLNLICMFQTNNFALLCVALNLENFVMTEITVRTFVRHNKRWCAVDKWSLKG